VGGLQLAGCLDQTIDGLCHPHRPAVADDAAEVESLDRVLTGVIAGGHAEVSSAAPFRAFTIAGSYAAGGSVAPSGHPVSYIGAPESAQADQLRNDPRNPTGNAQRTESGRLHRSTDNAG
jgi:hypothetical protein